MGAPAHSLGQASVGRAGYGGGFRAFAHGEGRVQRVERVLLEKGEGKDSEGEERGLSPP